MKLTNHHFCLWIIDNLKNNFLLDRMNFITSLIYHMTYQFVSNSYTRIKLLIKKKSMKNTENTRMYVFHSSCNIKCVFKFNLSNKNISKATNNLKTKLIIHVLKFIFTKHKQPKIHIYKKHSWKQISWCRIRSFIKSEKNK